MLPTLLGRWLTRILLFLVIGIPVTILYAFWLAEPGTPFNFELGGGFRIDSRPLQILCLLLLVGLLLDPLYYHIQKLRWDSDWPFSFQFYVSIVEFLIVLSLIELDLVSIFIPATAIRTSTDYFYVVLHFSLVFIPSFIALLGLVQLFMIRWRFKGGEWGRL